MGRLENYTVQPRANALPKTQPGEVPLKTMLKCKFPYLGQNAALQLLRRRREELVALEIQTTQNCLEANARLNALAREDEQRTQQDQVAAGREARHLTLALQETENQKRLTSSSSSSGDPNREGTGFVSSGFASLVGAEGLLSVEDQKIISRLLAPKTEKDVQQDTINAALLGATVGTAVILAAMGIQSFVTYVIESLQPGSALKFVSVALTMLLYLAILYFFVTIFCR